MKRIIYLDAGHFVSDPGAVSKYGVERDCMMKIRDLLADKLTNHFTVFKVPDTLGLGETIAYVNSCAKKLDDGYALALHLNSNAGVPGAGAEGWYAGGFPAADTVTQAQGMMKSIVDEYCAVTGYKNRGTFPDAKNPIHHRLGFVRDTKCYAGLIELCFVNNKEEMEYFLNKQEQIAQALYQGVLKAFGISFLQTNEDEDMIVDENKLKEIYNELLFDATLDEGAMGYVGQQESFVRAEVMRSPERKVLEVAVAAMRDVSSRGE